ncbi:MAG: TonB-dependent receptor [Candidatus Cloacimonetes bacterium]|nr:TonB-dependent receptor [Candidatus Cloacimonadota bacterium]
MKLLLLLIFVSFNFAGEQNILNVLSSVEEKLNSKSTSGATKSLTSVKKAPAIVKSYTNKDLEKFSSLYDFLNTVNGFKIEASRRNARYIQVRGNNHQIYNNKVLVTINGHKIADEVGPETHLDMIPIWSIKRLEIVKGPGSVLYGANAFAASIHITTFSGNSYKKSNASVGLGNDGQHTLKLELIDQVSPKTHSYFSFQMKQLGGKNRPSVDGVSTNGLGIPYAAVYDADPNSPNHTTFATVEDYQLKDHVQSYFGLVNHNQWQFMFGKFNSSRNTDYTRVSQQHSGNQQEYNYFGVQYDRNLSTKAKLKFLSKYSDVRVESSESGLNALDPGNIEFQTHSNSYAFDMELKIDYKANDTWSFVFGTIRETINFNRAFDRLFLNAANLNIGSRLTNPVDTNIEGYYLQATQSISDRLNVLYGYRINRNSHFGDEETPKIAATYQLSTDEYLKVVYGRSFRYPSGHEAFTFVPGSLNHNVTLRNEKVSSIEYGYTKDFSNGRSQLEINHFEMKINDFLYQNDTINQHDNDGPFYSRGYEISFKDQVNDHWMYNVEYTKMRYKGIETVDPNPQSARVGLNSARILSGGFEHSSIEKMVNFGFQYKTKDRWTIDYFAKYTGPELNRWDGRFAYQDLGGYTLHNIVIDYKHSDTRSIKLSVNNMFEKEYVFPEKDIQGGKVWSYPLGRMISLEYKVKF